MMRYQLDDKQLAYAKKHYNQAIEPGETSHSHPLLAYEREMQERFMLNLATSNHGSVTDVGSSARRVRQYFNSSEVWCTMPVLGAADAFRVAEAEAAGLDGYCCHTLEECDCVIHNAFTSTHVLYHLGPAAIASAIRRCRDHRFYAVAHVFPAAYGSMTPDAEYRTINDTTVMTVNGNFEPYRTPSTAWMNGTCSVRIDDVSLIWKCHSTLGVTHVFEFALAAIPDPLVVVSDFQKVLSSTAPMQYVPHVTSDKPFDLSTTEGDIEIESVVAYTRELMVVCTKTTQRKVHLPRGVVEYVATQLIAHKRDLTSFLDAKHHARAYVNKINVPPDMLVDTVLYGGYLGFLATVKQESDLLTTIRTKHFDAITMFNDSLGSFNSRLGIDWWSMLRLALEFTLAAGFLATAHMCMPSGRSTNVTTATIGCLVMGGFNYRLGLNFVTSSPWSLYRKVEGRSCNAVAHAPHHVHYPGVISSKEPAPQRADSVIRRVPPRVVRRHPAREAVRLIHASIAFDTVTPVVIEPNAQMELLAIQNRVTREVRAPDVDICERFYAVLNSAPFQTLAGEIVPYTRKTYAEWNRRFPRSVADRHDAVRRLITDHAEPIRMTSIASSFIKMEKVSFASSPSGVDDPTPRLIQGQTDKLNVIQGPWFYQFGQLLKRKWDGSECLFYTSGQNADTLGQWFHERHADFANVAYILIDYTKFDSTVNEPCYNLALSVYEQVGMRRHSQVWQATKLDSRQKGYTRFGYYYETSYGTGSGKADTSVKNSMINAALALMTLQDTTQFRMCVMGDDSLIIGEAEYLQPLCSQLVANAQALGFEPKLRYTTDLHEVDYCSKIPYPAVDPTTGADTIVFGPKIGKLLHKIGWNLNMAGVKSQAQTMREILQAMAHVPFAREFAQRVNHLLTDRTFKHVADPGFWATSRAYTESEHIYTMMLTPRYGLTRQHLEEFVAILAAVESLPYVVHWPVIEHICAVDDAC